MKSFQLVAFFRFGAECHAASGCCPRSDLKPCSPDWQWHRNPVVAPTRILPCHAHDQTLEFLIHGRLIYGLAKPRPRQTSSRSILHTNAAELSGLAAAATSARALCPRRLAISANVAFSESDSSNRPLMLACKMRFS